MPLLISTTYQTFMPHDEEDICEPDEQGFESEDVPMTFREIVEKLEFCEPSSSPLPENPNRWDWANELDADEDYRTGERTYRAYHLSCSNGPRADRWWGKALHAAEQRRRNRWSRYRTGV